MKAETKITLTDEQICAIFDDGRQMGCAIHKALPFARAIEQAVLAATPVAIDNAAVLNADDGETNVRILALRNANDVLMRKNNELRAALRYYAKGQHIQRDKTGVANVEYIEQGTQAQRALASQPSAQPSDTPADVSHGGDIRQAVKNALCINGHLNQTLNLLMLNNEPDAQFNIIAALAHKAVDMAFNAAPQVAQPSAEAITDEEQHAFYAQKKPHDMSDDATICAWVAKRRATPPTVDQSQEVVIATVMNKYGDPEAFAERHLEVNDELLQNLPIGTTLIAASKSDGAVKP